MDEKKRAALKAVEWVKDGMIIGLGTGSTSYYAIEAIGKLVKEGHDLVGVPTSRNTESLAIEFGIPLVSLENIGHIDLTIDGADEVDPKIRLIKGMGGALLREKIVASISSTEIIAIDDTKLVQVLGTKSPLPVEVVPFGHRRTKDAIEKFGCKAILRGGDSPFVTDSGNYIYDCRFTRIENPEELEKMLNLTPGVVENGLFIDLATRVVIGTKDGVIVKERSQD
ncbi:MAG: ribose-5-phosphate isomerase RpiA [Methanomassiliicoccales archaeon]|nr:ribose-5-phosphate isomerase RpiA [Methanomassiliicoccales archaeon]